MAPELTPNQKLMDTNNDGRVSKREREAFRQRAPEQVASQWGIGYALITQLRNSPEPDAQAFAKWFDSQVDKYRRNPTAWSFDAFKLEMDSQPWRQRYNSQSIEDMDLEARFPDLYRQQLDAEVETLRDMAVQFGADVDDVKLRELAKQKRRFGMNESQLRNALAGLIGAESGNFRGASGALQSDLRSWARRNGLSLSDNIINDYVRRVQAGDTTKDDVYMDLRRKYLMGAYPAWADDIEAGRDPYDLSAPYRATVASLLELNEEQLDLDDPLIGQAMQSGMTLTDLKMQIRKDPRWQTTDNAYRTYASLGEELLGMFGFR